MTTGPGGAGVATALVCAAALALLAGWSPAEPAPPADPVTPAPAVSEPAVRYSRDVRAILSDRCFQCHGADAPARQADLRLDERAFATADLGGYAAIVPGDPAASELWRRINAHDDDDRMPPASAKRRALSDDERQTLRRWIEQGAVYEQHWAYVAPVRPELPAVTDDDWPAGPLDRFVLAGLEAAGVAPSPPPDGETLLRRVFLDVTGLPPTVEELDAFLADAEADTGDAAYARVVERLFTSELYRARMAEHLTTPWLDAARYADTIGIHTDNGRQLWLWRDWVLEAFRDGMPYDRFVTEQLAGDLIPDATVQQQVASGFNRAHTITDEGGAIDDEYLVEYAVDRVNTTSTVFLGLTMGCARCHDHKFDPLTQDDYYGLVAFFNSNDEPGLYSQTKDSNRAYEPFLEVPSEVQLARIEQLEAALANLDQRLSAPLPGEEDDRAAFLADVHGTSGVDWALPEVLSAASSEQGVTFDVQSDGSILVGGRMPDVEDYTIELATEQDDLRLLLLEALESEGGPAGAGRAFHGNVVLTGVTLRARPRGGAGDWTDVPLTWTWADHTQTNRDYQAVNALSPDNGRGWAADGNEDAGPRALLFLADERFGYPGGTELRVELAFRSPFAQHAMGHIRFRTSPLDDTARLPVAYGRWYEVGPFREADSEEDRQGLYDVAYGPEQGAVIDTSTNFGAGNQSWAYDADLVDDRVSMLPDGLGVHYVGREIWSPDARSLEVSLGSDDGFQLYLNGELVAERRVDRGVAPDQDTATLPLLPGPNALVFKIINTGGAAGFYHSARPAKDVLVGEIAASLLPPEAVNVPQQQDLTRAWRRRFFDGYQALELERERVDVEIDALRDGIPRAMVMSELEERRETYVLMRGQYDHPDERRPVDRTTPAVLPPLPDGAPVDRLGLARWMTMPDNPLFARVAVNRFWEQVFGAGLVRTSADFGLQGEWPTHPELLDWLAVEFRESGWDVRGLLRQFVLSSTYRQSSRVRPELAERDPDNRLLASYPRRRLSAEQIRDQALYVSGLLVEQLGGPSVKPYQPAGLWKEVAMLASNTREFELDEGQDLWRRSLYTYWKRAVPPPSLQTFDAPTRESCVISRQRTNTPLQALVLWNDEQYVEAARSFAARVLEEDRDDTARLLRLFRSATGRRPEPDELQLLVGTLADFRARFAEQPDDAAQLLAVGMAPVDDELPPAELAAWSMLASAVLSLHETLTQD